MKTQSFLLPLLFIFFSAAANAQFSFGIKGGYSNAWHPDVINTLGGRQAGGLLASLQIYRRINKYLELGIEPGLAQRGGGVNHFSEAYLIDCINCQNLFLTSFYEPGTLTANFVQMPVLARANLPFAGQKMGLLGKIGFGPSWLASGYIESITYDPLSGEQPLKINALDFDNNELKRWGWGIYAGTGIGFRPAFGMLAIEIEWYGGQWQITNAATTKNRSVSYSFSYLIDL